MKTSSPYYLKLHPKDNVEVERFYEKYFTQRRTGVGTMKGMVWGHMQDGYYVMHPDKTLGFYYEEEWTAISEEEYAAALDVGKKKEAQQVAGEVFALYRIANDAYLYQYRAKVERVVDGDTYDLLIDLGFETFVRRRVRLYGVNTPEIKGEERELGLQAKARVVELIEGKTVMVISCDYKGKYGRPLVKVLIPHMGRQDLGDLLLKENHGTEEYFD